MSAPKDAGKPLKKGVAVTDQSAGAGSPAARARVVLITAPDREVGLRLARGLVSTGCAACVNLVPGIVSVYTWEGKLQEDSEVLLVAKTCLASLPRLEEFLQREHPYEVPECIALEPAHVEPSYLAWLLDACQSPGDA